MGAAFMSTDNQTTARCPTCGHPVPSIFHHIGIDCEHDMTAEQIAQRLLDAEDQGSSTLSHGQIA
jgi:hypothetical protein